jgi:protein SCO1/2
MLSITLDPARDTVEVLRQYARMLGAKPGWYFLTGKHEEIEMLRHKLGVYDPDPAVDADKTQHAGIVVYGNEALGRWAAIPGLARAEFIAETVLKVVRPKGTGPGTFVPPAPGYRERDR